MGRNAATPGNNSGDPNPAETPGDNLPAEELNEHETIIGVDEQSCPKPLRLFQAWTAIMEKPNAEAAKFAQANAQQAARDERTHLATQKTAAEELVRASIAVDMIDIAKQIAKSNCGRGELERLAAAQTDNEEKQLTHWQCLLGNLSLSSNHLRCRLLTQNSSSVTVCISLNARRQ